MTKTLIVVDDETIIANGITQMVKRFGLDIEVTQTFYSSLAAIDYLQATPTDLIITDINMPELNGLALIQKIKKISPTTQTIVLTGFGTLDYATEAMRYGVRFFLQKPTQPAELRTALQKSLDLVAQDVENERLQYKHKMEQLLSGQQAAADTTETLSLICYEATQQVTKLSSLDDWLSAQQLSWATGVVENTGYLVCQVADLTEAVTLLEQATGQPDFAVWEDHLSAASARQTFMACQSALQYRFYGTTRIIRLGDIPTTQPLTPNLQEMVWPALRQKKFWVAGQAIQRFLQTCGKLFVPVRVAKESCRDLLGTIYETYQMRQDQLIDALRELTSAQRADQVQAVYAQVYRQIQEVVSQQPGDAVSMVNLLIQQCYADEQLSLRWIAKNKLFMNSEYLGKLYAKETGQKFNDVLTIYRLTEAKKLLKQGNRVYDVAEQVGYGNSVDYFSKQFKRQVGCTPKQFQTKG